MQMLHASLAPLIVVAGVAGAWHAGLLPTMVPTTAPAMTRSGPVLPLAALAWAQQHCDATLRSRPGAARVHAEDLRRVAAHFDSLHDAQGLAAACAGAIDSAGPARDPQPPSRSIEALVAAALPVR